MEKELEQFRQEVEQRREDGAALAPGVPLDPHIHCPIHEPIRAPFVEPIRAPFVECVYRAILSAHSGAR